MKRYLLLLLSLCFIFAACAGRIEKTYGAHGPAYTNDAVPLAVAVIDSDLEAPCIHGAQVWNDAVDFALFYVMPAEGADYADLVVDSAPDRDLGDGDCCYSNDLGQRVLNVDTADAALAAYLCAHELGHALGLEHDGDPDSLMNHWMPEGSGLMDGEGGPNADMRLMLPPMRVSPADARAVRQHYRRLTS